MAKVTQKYAVGTELVHNKFGRGKVILTELSKKFNDGEQPYYYYTIHFDSDCDGLNRIFTEKSMKGHF